MEILQLPALRSFLRRLSFRTACQLFSQLNWTAISSQPPLQSSTGHSTTKPKLSSFITNLHGPNRKHRFQQYLYCCLRIRCSGNVFTEPLPSNERLLWLHYSGLQASCHNMMGTQIATPGISLRTGTFLPEGCLLEVRRTLRDVSDRQYHAISRVRPPQLLSLLEASNG
jgi:hypothetical protein